MARHCRYRRQRHNDHCQAQHRRLWLIGNLARGRRPWIVCLTGDEMPEVRIGCWPWTTERFQTDTSHISAELDCQMSVGHGQRNEINALYASVRISGYTPGRAGGADRRTSFDLDRRLAEPAEGGPPMRAVECSRPRRQQLVGSVGSFWLLGFCGCGRDLRR